MTVQNRIYRENLSLLTDLYQVTMAYAAWKNGIAEGSHQTMAAFDLYFRSHPFKGGYAVLCGLESVLDFVEGFHFADDDCEYLGTLKGVDGRPLFEVEFLNYLRNLKLQVNIDAIEEGRVVFAGEPLIRVEGPLLQCQLLETPLLTLINFQTLIATKASRMREAAGKDSILEFGLRRAQGIDGGLTASRACYVGGIDATSNTLAGKLYGIPVKGTHAHSWVMAFKNEVQSFEKYAFAMPNNTILLVDTYDTLDGVRNAITVGLKMKKANHKLLGIRLDSGDLAYLSTEARKLLDEAGLQDVAIVASNELDEHLIQNLKQQDAKVNIWGIGTKLVTGQDQPALGGVYKLVAVKEKDHEWENRIKISEQAAKVTTPGIHQVRRYRADNLWLGDMIYDIRTALEKEPLMIDPIDPTRRKLFSSDLEFEDLLKPLVRNGQVVARRPPLEQIRKKREQDIQGLHPTIRRFFNPHIYPVGLESTLHKVKHQMILDFRHHQKLKESP